MNGEKASLMATDPPYLVDYTGGNHPASKGNQGKPSKDKHWDEYVDPEASVEFYRKFLTLSLEHLNPNPPKDTDGRREESGRGVRELQGK